ncbi:hypothetical protein CO058_02365 [candidate division WWE3 bacterium CG_4_9_14_0_2_um_filter_35_11]|uniref:Glycosyl transferase family 1 domain-containing protein n=1 Tax=candidate division WWE3 bacterium CG_4_9_14_0_2_um_filter_35_11 TaxID=1975077 RepID=A0A2M8ELS7_UNCKA|nr:MAG: hypothetical protein COV25_00355 [candidate division WWE3 bacterium CG10_big_fil_rev_8_21_14_0_10_35_32]PJC23692.1 MAG: hypothetical protein CO058_02365 [candidate division WWE3 bacterium CG_4_9_14_0_2_um_filter_35_11]
MKILFQSRVDLYNPRGGDTFQIEKTKSAIEKLDPNIKIDISLNVHEKNISDYDIVHLFNIDWVCETYMQAKFAKDHHKPLVISAIHHSYKEVLDFENFARYDIRRIYNLIVKSQPLRDVGKNVYRSFFNRKKLYPTILQVLMGIRNQQRKILRMSDIVLVQTKQESKDLITDFGVSDFKSELVVNGVDADIFNNASRSPFQKFFMEKYSVDISKKKVLLNVGRVEPRKNQLNLIKAFEMLKESQSFDGYILIFVGVLSERSPEYIYRFNSEIKNHEDIFYVGALPQQMLASAMSQDGIYVHPSWFETTGLVSLEATLAGMTPVVSGDRVKEYLGDYGYYCDPKSPESIKNAILKASESSKNTDVLRKRILREFTWDNAALQTIFVYKSLLSKSK